MRHSLFIGLLLISINFFAQPIQGTYAVVFYNVENLYDTKRDKNIDDVEFTPDGLKKWTQSKYQKKLNNISYVIRELEKKTASGITLIGLAEIENKTVLEDLTKNKNISSTGYKIVHSDSPDKRGSDVALLYNPQLFKLKSYKTYAYKSPDSPWIKSRDFLLVNGEISGQPVHVIVNHWPSRRGEKSAEQREYAAKVCKQIHDSLYKSNPKAAIIIMGDLNDNPNDKSCRIILKAQKDAKNVKAGGLYNTMWKLYESGIGSYRYRGKWYMYDQIIISQSLIDTKSSLRFTKAEVFNPDFLIQQKGSFKGYPFRSFSGNTFINGYSDHFPTLIYLKHEKL